MRCDLLVEDGLREERLVDLVVPHPSVAHHVDDAVLAELRARKEKIRDDAESIKREYQNRDRGHGSRSN